MTGCPVAGKCLVVSWVEEALQQPTWPQLGESRKCSHLLPLFRHSLQPSALGVTLRMPAMWLQPFATGSHVLGVEEHDIGATACKLWHICRCVFPLSVTEGTLDRGHAVKGKNCDHMNAGRPGRRRNGSPTNLKFSKARHFLRERDVSLGIMFFESSRIFWRFVQHDDFGHCVSPFEVTSLERFQAKWRPVRVKKTRQIKNLEPRFDSIETERALDVLIKAPVLRHRRGTRAAPPPPARPRRSRRQPPCPIRTAHRRRLTRPPPTFPA